MALDLNYRHEFRGMRPEDITGRIVLWLQKENAQKVISDGKASVEASHGSLKCIRSWERNGRKKLKFAIAPTSGGVTVTVTATPSMANSSDVAMMLAEAKLNWGLLLEECWSAVEGVAVTESGRRMAEIKHEITTSNREIGKKMVLNGSIGFVLVFVLGVAAISLTDGAVPSVVVVVPSVMFALTAFWGFMKMRD